jgi:hypothetical protein
MPITSCALHIHIRKPPILSECVTFFRNCIIFSKYSDPSPECIPLMLLNYFHLFLMSPLCPSVLNIFLCSYCSPLFRKVWFCRNYPIYCRIKCSTTTFQPVSHFSNNLELIFFRLIPQAPTIIIPVIHIRYIIE